MPRVSFFKLPFHWLRIAGPYRALWLLGPLLLYSWTVTGPFVSDDLHLLLKAEKWLQDGEGSWRLYRFADSDASWQALRDRGTSPWWVSSSDRLDFLRPVTEASFLFDVWMFGRHPLPYRLMSLAVLAVALMCLHWMFMQATAGDRVRAGLATFFFGISQTATPPATWLCNRQDLLVVIGVSLAAGAYWATRRRPRWGYVALAVGGFAFALLSKEVAIALAAVVAVHELWQRRHRATRWERPRAGMIAVLLVVCATTYLGYYVWSRPWLMDLSAETGTPSQLNANLPVNLLVYASVWMIGFPIDVLFGASREQVYMLAAVSAGLLLIAIHYLRKSTRDDGAAVFFALWLLLFIMPGLRALTTSTRTLCVPTIGWVYLLVGLIVPTREEDCVIPTFLRQWYYAACGVVSIGCAIGTVLFMNSSERAARERIAKIVESFETPLNDGDAVLVSRAESSLELICGGDRLECLTGKRDVALSFLMSPWMPGTVVVQDDDTLLIQSTGASLFDTPMHRLTLGREWSPRQGFEWQHGAFTARIAESDAEGVVRTVSIHLRKPLSSDRLHVYPPRLAEANSGAERTFVRARKDAVRPLTE